MSSSTDWLSSVRTSLVAWGVPHAALVAGLLVGVPARTVVWTAALLWMGIACIGNSRRCGRTHCRYTGPYYLIAILPVLALGIAAPSSGVEIWIVLGVGIVGGSKLIWWASERIWGRYT